MSINFTANLMNRTTVMQQISTNNYWDTDVSIVELDVNNDLDIKAIEETKNKWIDNGAMYIHHIYDDAVEPHQYYDVEKSHFYALTTQNADFNKLKSDKILGVMMFSEIKSNLPNEITWLEVNPETNKTLNKNREFKNVGTRLIEFVKNTFKTKNIHVHSAYNAQKFYKKNGFISMTKKIPDKYDMYLLR